QEAIPEMISDVRNALEEAGKLINQLPPNTVGKILIDATGRSIHTVDELKTVGQQAIAAVEGGAWPSSPDIDHFIIARIIDSYGRNGEKLWTAEPTRPTASP